MERLEYPNKGNAKDTEQELKVLRGYLNNLVDTLNYNFEQIESKLNEGDDK